MTDFHTHILPGVDDGAEDVRMSYAMLRREAEQGVDTVVATSHFYPDEDSLRGFIRRRDNALEELNGYLERKSAAEDSPKLPRIVPGAEVLYFPGMCECEDILSLTFGKKKFLLVEPWYSKPWTGSVLDDIESTGSNFGVIPVVAHVDRYMRMFEDDNLFLDFADRRILMQFNTSFFIREDSRELSLKLLRRGLVHFIGSDCHNATSRPPNIGYAAKSIISGDCGDYLSLLMSRAEGLL